MIRHIFIFIMKKIVSPIQYSVSFRTIFYIIFEAILELLTWVENWFIWVWDRDWKLVHFTNGFLLPKQGLKYFECLMTNSGIERWYSMDHSMTSLMVSCYAIVGKGGRESGYLSSLKSVVTMTSAVLEPSSAWSTRDCPLSLPRAIQISA